MPSSFAPPRKINRSALLVALIFLFAALLGLLVTDSYGSGVDENTERRTLNVNIRSYAELIYGANSEEALAISEHHISDWRDRDYGQAKFYFIWPLMHALESAGNNHGMIFVYHYYMHLLFLLGLFGLYSIVRRLTGSRAFGLISAAFLYLNPRFFAESFYNNKDIVLLSLCLIVWWTGLRFIEKDNWSSCVWFGFAGALTANFRILGLAAFGLCGIVYLAVRISSGSWNRRCFWRGFAAVACFLLFFYLLTPACWGSFFEFWKYQILGSADFSTARWNGNILYRGALYNPERNPIPWHYIPWLMLITTPLLLFVLAGLWVPQFLVRSRFNPKNWLSLENAYTIALAVFFAAPLVYAMLARPNLYNGWRHMYFIYLSVVIIAGVSLAWLWQSRKKALRILLCTAVGLHFLYYSGYMAANHPVQFAYFNFLAGAHPEEQYDTDYWYIGQKTVMEELQKADPNFSIAPANSNTHLNWVWYINLDTLSQPASSKSEEVTWDRRGRARYVLENSSEKTIYQLSTGGVYDDPSVVDWHHLLQQQEPIMELYCDRTLLWRAYVNPQYNGQWD